MKALLAALAVAVLLSGCAASDRPTGGPGTGTGSTSGTGTGASGAQHVALQDNRFDPATLSVAAGTQVEFTNHGQRPHTVTIHFAPDPPATLKLDEELAAGGKASYSFPSAGTYHVWCELHGSMTTGMAMVVTAT